MEEAAEELLANAVRAEGSGRLEESLSLYQQSLQAFLEVYKTMSDAEGMERKALILGTIESNMVQAERIKSRLEAQKNKKDEPFSIFRIFSSSSNEKATKQTAESAVPIAKPSSAPATAVPTTFTAPRALPADPNPNAVAARKPRAGPSAAPATAAAGAAAKRAKVPSPGVKRTSPPTALPTSAGPRPNEMESQILEDMLDSSPGVHWDDIAGLSFAKQTLQEAVVLPNLRPDLFTGLRRPPKGVLLFGPPGTGKTLLAKAVATESGFSFFTISAASVTSKYLGDGEKLMRALFDAARARQPAVIFFDEIDALMSTRKDGEHEASRRVKTEFMTQLDGAATSSDDRVLVMAATNLPWEIDEAVLRRLVKRIYIPLPDKEARRALILHCLHKQGPKGAHLSDAALTRLVAATEGYSGSDLTAACQEAALGPIREIDSARLRSVRPEDVRAIKEQDFISALRVIRASVSQQNLEAFQKWSAQFGASR